MRWEGKEEGGRRKGKTGALWRGDGASGGALAVTDNGIGGGCGTAEGGGGQCLLFDMWFALRCFFLQNNIDIVF